jgi:hypothetical protein
LNDSHALREKTEAFLTFIRCVYDPGGRQGPVRLDVAVVGNGTFPAVRNTVHLSDFLILSERTALRASIESDYDESRCGSDVLESEDSTHRAAAALSNGGKCRLCRIGRSADRTRNSLAVGSYREVAYAYARYVLLISMYNVIAMTLRSTAR